MDSYMAVGEHVVKYVLKRKHPFDTDGVYATLIVSPKYDTFISTIGPKVMRRYIEEWLWGIAEPHEGISTGVYEAVRANPKLTARVQKRWKGWYPSKPAGGVGKLAADVKALLK